jgi:hypothetical protein
MACCAGKTIARKIKTLQFATGGYAGMSNGLLRRENDCPQNKDIAICHRRLRRNEQWLVGPGKRLPAK